MTKNFKCNNVWTDCNRPIFESIESELMQQTIEHLKRDHNIQEIS